MSKQKYSDLRELATYYRHSNKHAGYIKAIQKMLNKIYHVNDTSIATVLEKAVAHYKSELFNNATAQKLANKKNQKFR